MKSKTFLHLLKIVAAAIALTLLADPMVAQTTDIIWSAPTPVAASSFGSSSPRIGKLANGEIVAVWGKSGTSPKIYLSRMVGDNFEAPVQLGDRKSVV